MPGSCYATARKCLAAENDCADISTWTKNLKGIKIYYGDNYGTTQKNNAYKVDDLGILYVCIRYIYKYEQTMKCMRQMDDRKYELPYCRIDFSIIGFMERK